MSNKNENCDKEYENLNIQNEDYIIFTNDLLSKYDFLKKSLNYIIENFPKEDKYDENSISLSNLFVINNIFFYNKLLSIKEKLDLCKEINGFAMNNNIENKKENILNSEKIKEIFNNYYIQKIFLKK